MNESFKSITDYCIRTGKGLNIRDHAYCIFMSVLQSALDKHHASNGADAKPKEIASMESTLLTADAIEGYVARAEAKVASYEKAFHAKQFWFSVMASILGALLYSLLLLLIFWVARDQIDAWLQQLSNK